MLIYGIFDGVTRKNQQAHIKCFLLIFNEKEQVVVQHYNNSLDYIYHH